MNPLGAPSWASGCWKGQKRVPLKRGPPRVILAAASAACLLLLLGAPKTEAFPGEMAPTATSLGPHLRRPWRAAPQTSGSTGAPAGPLPSVSVEALGGLTIRTSSVPSPEGPSWGPPIGAPHEVSLWSFFVYKGAEVLDFPVFVQCLICVGFLCLLGSLFVFSCLFYSHLSSYYEPKLQRMICRIGCTMPLFALLSSAACLSVFSELKHSHESPLGPPDLLGAPMGTVPSWALSPAADAPAAAAAAADTSGHLRSVAPTVEPGVPSVGGGPWALGAPVRELAAVSGLETEGASGGPQGATWRAPPGAPALEASRKSSGGGAPLSGSYIVGGPSEGPPVVKVAPPHRASYYVQQQLFFELGKQLAQSTALYSFASLITNACGKGNTS